MIKQLVVYCAKEMLIGEHNQRKLIVKHKHKPLLVIPATKEALIGIVLWDML